MKEKSINIEIPTGYTIDEEKSTFSKIVFKPIESKVYYDPKGRGVIVEDDGEKFLILEIDWNFQMNWNDAKMCCDKTYCAKLPSKKWLEIAFKHKLEINVLLKCAKLIDSWYWTREEYSSSYAWHVSFDTGDVYSHTKSYTGYVRPFTSL